MVDKVHVQLRDNGSYRVRVSVRQQYKVRRLPPNYSPVPSLTPEREVERQIPGLIDQMKPAQQAELDQDQAEEVMR